MNICTKPSIGLNKWSWQGTRAIIKSLESWNKGPGWEGTTKDKFNFNFHDLQVTVIIFAIREVWLESQRAFRYCILEWVLPSSNIVVVHVHFVISTRWIHTYSVIHTRNVSQNSYIRLIQIWKKTGLSMQLIVLTFFMSRVSLRPSDILGDVNNVN